MSTGKKFGIGCGGCLGALLFLALMGGCMAAIGGSTASPPQVSGSPSAEETAVEETTEEPAEDEPEEEEPVEEDTSTVSDGVHQVGNGVEPGVYTTDGPDPDDLMPMCYYARLSGLSGELDDIITNNNIEGPGTLEVAESDVALELSGGCEWTRQE